MVVKKDEPTLKGSSSLNLAADDAEGDEVSRGDPAPRLGVVAVRVRLLLEGLGLKAVLLPPVTVDGPPGAAEHVVVPAGSTMRQSKQVEEPIAFY